MRKKTFLRAVALVACFSILTLTVPTVSAADRDAKNFEFKIFVKKQMERLTSLLPFLNKFFDTEKNPTTPDNTVNVKNTNSTTKIKVTGTLSSIKRPDGD